MIKLIKIKDPDNKFDTTNVTIELPIQDISLSELLEAMEAFITACGYGPYTLDATFIKEENNESENS